jgi:hypothetical protein
MNRECIERRETGLYIVGSRVPIDRIISEYRNGEDPALSVEQITGAIAYYQSHKDEVEAGMEERRRAEDAYTAANPNPPEIRKRFERMRQTAPRRF